MDIELEVDNFEARSAGSGYGSKIELALEIDEDEVFDMIGERVERQRIIDEFMNNCMDDLSRSEKEGILDKIGIDTIKEYFGLAEGD